MPKFRGRLPKIHVSLQHEEISSKTRKKRVSTKKSSTPTLPSQPASASQPPLAEKATLLPPQPKLQLPPPFLLDPVTTFVASTTSNRNNADIRKSPSGEPVDREKEVSWIQTYTRDLNHKLQQAFVQSHLQALFILTPSEKSSLLSLVMEVGDSFEELIALIAFEYRLPASQSRFDRATLWGPKFCESLVEYWSQPVIPTADCFLMKAMALYLIGSSVALTGKHDRLGRPLSGKYLDMAVDMTKTGTHLVKQVLLSEKGSTAQSLDRDFAIYWRYPAMLARIRSKQIENDLALLRISFSPSLAEKAIEERLRLCLEQFHVGIQFYPSRGPDEKESLKQAEWFEMGRVVAAVAGVCSNASRKEHWTRIGIGLFSSAMQESVASMQCECLHQMAQLHLDHSLWLGCLLDGSPTSQVQDTPLFKDSQYAALAATIHARKCIDLCMTTDVHIAEYLQLMIDSTLMLATVCVTSDLAIEFATAANVYIDYLYIHFPDHPRELGHEAIRQCLEPRTKHEHKAKPGEL